MKSILLVLTYLSAPLFGASFFDDWDLKGPLPTNSEIKDVEQGEGITVATFENPEGSVLVSNNGRDFSIEETGLPAGEFLNELLFSRGRWFGCGLTRFWTKEKWEDDWVEIGEIPEVVVDVTATSEFYWAWSSGFFSGTGRDRFWTGSRLYRSLDGITWHEISLTSSEDERLAISGLVEANGRYVLTNSEYGGLNSNGIWISGDGENWTPTNTNQATYTSVAYGNDLFLAGGNNGHVAVSEDGVNWRGEPFPFVIAYLGNRSFGTGTPVYAPAREVTFYQGEFHALTSGYGGSPMMVVSSDGSEWTVETWEGSYPSDFQRAQTTGFKASEHGLYLLGRHGNLWRMNDWETDREQLLPRVPWTWRAISASDQVVVAMGEGGNFVWSDDAETFTHGILPDPSEVYGVAWSGQEFVAVGGIEGMAAAWRSEDGQTWTSENVSWVGAPITSIVWDGRRFLICGEGGRMAQSPNGSFWSFIGSGTTKDLKSLAFDQGRYVVITADKSIRWSSDLMDWEEGDRIGETIAYGNGVWMFGQWRPQLTTDFEVWWEKRGGGTGDNLMFAFGHFLSVSHTGTLVASSDGTVWEGYGDLFAGSSNEAQKRFRHLTVFQNRLIGVGDDGLISVADPWCDLFAEWQSEIFTVDQLADENVSGPNADPDKDGWSNSMEYAFDSNPLEDERETRPISRSWQTDRMGGFDSVYSYNGKIGTYQYPYAPNRAGVAIWIERSEDLQTWRRDDIITNASRGWGDRRGSAESWIIIDGPRLNMLRIRANVVHAE